MKKYYDKKLPITVNVFYGERRAGVTYREIEQLKKENEELKASNEDMYRNWEKLLHKIGRAIKFIEDNANYNDFFDDVTAGLSSDNCSELLKKLKGE